jgi:membrane-associated protease RseP (regulator of RpoE activity)
MRGRFVASAAFAVFLVFSSNPDALAQALELLQSRPGQPLPPIGGYGRLNPKAKAEENAKYQTFLGEKREHEIAALKQAEKPSPYIGTGLYDPREFPSFGVPALTRGPWIVSIESGSPASAARLQRGDIITAVDGKQVSSPTDVSGIVASKGIGAELRLTVVRDSRDIDVSLTIGTRPSFANLEDDVAENIFDLCISGVVQGEGTNGAEVRAAKHLCTLAIVQGHEKTNEPLFEKLRAQFASCDNSNSILSDTGRQQVYSSTKAIDLSDGDLATILRVAAFCRMSKQPDVPASFAMWSASSSVLATYGADRRRETAGFVEARLMVEDSKLKSQRETQHIASLTSAGYKPISIQQLKVDARALHGKRVAVSGLMILIDNNSAALLQSRQDSNPVGVLLGEASRETRDQTIGRCTSSRGCQIEIKGTVIGDRDSVLIAAD